MTVDKKTISENSLLDVRDYQDLDISIALAQHTVYKKYLPELKDYLIIPPDQLMLDEEPENCIRAMQLKQFTSKKGEDIFQKLSTVYYASMALGCSVYVMIDVESVNAPAKIYLGIRNSDETQKRKLTSSYEALKEGLLSNFPGTQIQKVSVSQELKPELDAIFGKSTKYVSAVSCIAGLRDKNATENKNFVQGIEKLIDVMHGHAYTVLLIADPISAQQQTEIRNGYENLYSAMAPFKKNTWMYNETESTAVMESLTTGISKAVTRGASQTQGHTATITEGESSSATMSRNYGENSSQQNTRSTSSSRTTPTSTSVGGNVLSSLGSVGLLASGNPLIMGALAPFAPAILGAGAAERVVGGALAGRSVSEGITESIGKSMGVYSGVSTGNTDTISHSTAEALSQSSTTSSSSTDTESESSTQGVTATKGIGRTLQIENENKSIEEMLKHIDEQLKRLEEFEDYGAYNCGAYFLSGKRESSLLAANTYRALMIGDGTGMENGAVNSWSDPEAVEVLKEYLRRMEQPVFAVPLTLEPKNMSDFLIYSAGTIVSGLELPLHLGLPTKSVIGLPVIEHAEFGRNVEAPADAFVLGKMYHMGQTEKNAVVSLGKENMALHTFITGSTGTGKSNAIYHILDELTQRNVHFLVIEPTKGEHKNIFGGREDVSVYGTNIQKTPLLTLNPFSFPGDIHVLEHIDRLVEIFNACWPMYAAMPAVLKDAMEQAYKRKGWDLSLSECTPRLFPTFEDLVDELPKIITQSSYSSDTKGDYIGALVTRVKSLTNGINGQIFCSGNELKEENLFENNVIIDISRVGSVETRSLLMGILVMKLQEYRMASNGMNEPLKHITVLEEAHDLLKRTSAVQMQDGANLQGKSVEMIGNAIAEMRTYGEGFIIADQAPGLLDPAVIRNTNTKIILRLPDEEDRMLVGKAASLNLDQIAEVAKLPRGVAAVYQNGWQEAVLCQIDFFEKSAPFEYQQPAFVPDMAKEKLLSYILSDRNERLELTDEEQDYLRQWIIQISIGLSIREELLQLVDTGDGKRLRGSGYLCYCLVKGKTLLQWMLSLPEKQYASAKVDRHIQDSLHISLGLASEIRKCVVLYAADYMKGQNDMAQYHALMEYGGIQ